MSGGQWDVDDLRNRVLRLHSRGKHEEASKAEAELRKAIAPPPPPERKVKPVGRKVNFTPAKTNRKGMEASVQKLGKLSKAKLATPDSKKGKVKARLHVIQEGNTVIAIKTKSQDGNLVGYSASAYQDGKRKWSQAKEAFIL